MISTMGDPEGAGKGQFLLLDDNFKVCSMAETTLSNSRPCIDVLEKREIPAEGDPAQVAGKLSQRMPEPMFYR